VFVSRSCRLPLPFSGGEERTLLSRARVWCGAPVFGWVTTTRTPSLSAFGWSPLDPGDATPERAFLNPRYVRPLVTRLVVTVLG
jgi:hypothetical protein